MDIQCKSEVKFGPSSSVYKFIPSIEITVNWKSTKLLKVKKNYRSFWFSVVIAISSSEIKDLCYEWRVVVKKRFGSFLSLFDKVERCSRVIKSSSWSKFMQRLENFSCLFLKKIDLNKLNLFSNLSAWCSRNIKKTKMLRENVCFREPWENKAWHLFLSHIIYKTKQIHQPWIFWVN